MGLLVKACLNGNRPPGSHPALPLTPPELAADAAAAVAAGAGAFHVHPRDTDGRETLDAVVVDTAVAEMRAACPGVPVGVSTGEWIVPDLTMRVAAISGWREPDFASVNLSEDGHGEVMAALRDAGIGIEAGVFTVDGVGALQRSGFAGELVRVLIEPEDADGAAAARTAWAIDAALDAAGIDAPRLHHGEHVATWIVLRRAIDAGRDVRIGLEDTLVVADGRPTSGNAELVAAAVALGA
jgi:uncharacterized protein (DUF849 family)